MTNLYENSLTALTLIAVSVQFFNWWFISKGKLEISYLLSVIVYGCLFIIDLMLATHDSAQHSIYLFTAVNVWAFIMALKGSKRISNENKRRI